jgi:hypothetical protein
MSTFLLPKTSIKRMDKLPRRFFWQGVVSKGSSFSEVDLDLQKQEERGAGVKVLRKINISLVCKWWWLLENERGIWQDIVQIKYVKNKPIFLVKNRQTDSSVWSDLLKIRHIYLKGREFIMNSGEKISF